MVMDLYYIIICTIKLSCRRQCEPLRTNTRTSRNSLDEAQELAYFIMAITRAITAAGSSAAIAGAAGAEYAGAALAPARRERGL